jgi:hypothetical protein
MGRRAGGFKWIAAITIFTLTACGGVAGTGENPTEAPQPAEPVLPTPTATAAPAVTVVPPPTPEPSEILYTAPCQGAEEGSSWCLLSHGEQEVVMPPTVDAQLYDYDPVGKLALFGSHFPTHGAGAANMAVTDLMVWNLDSGETQPVVPEEQVVKAAWGPGGAVAYIYAAEATNELRWRPVDGEEKVLAGDVPHLFSVAPSGREVAFARESLYDLGGEPGLYIVEVESRNERKVSDADRAGTGGDDYIRWSPDEGWLVMPVSQQLLLAAADGSSAGILQYDESLAQEPWYQRLPTNVLWHPEGDRLVASVETGGPGLPEPVEWLVLIFRLDLSNAQILAAEQIYNDGLLVGWDVIGESLWVNRSEAPGTPLSIPLTPG